MQRKRVRSSVLASVGYESGTLEVEVRGGNVYQYFIVPRHVYEELMAAPSHGSFFNTHIRDRYPCVRLSGG
ncbi:MAG: KTSC domain-containing protein [Streptosporangiales bacterium]